ncbi:MAG: efflux RND transporter periplasmic adaptor subunit [Flavobacteriaceae bacterium]|nr:efflux RND transporter periplasmic adaptor subunit [Flavobacteriaceae bacterium]
MKYKIAIVTLLILFNFSCKKKEVKVMPPQKVEVYKVVPKTVPIHREFVGQLYGEKDIPIRARVEGYLEGIYFKEGSKVKKGQLLYVIDADPFKEDVASKQSMVAQAETILVQTESDLKRIKPLAEIDAVSKRELDIAQAQRDASISSVEAAEANLNIAEINLSYTRILSPIDGIIGRTLAREGEFVGRDPNPVILNTVSDINTVRVQFFLSENEYLKLARAIANHQENKKQKREIELILSDGSIYKHKGTIDFIDRNINTSTGTILIQATFPNTDGLLRPGQFARVKIKVQEAENTIIVPQKCVSELQGMYSVLLVNSENKVETSQVKVGEKVGEFWIIKEGVKEGDQVILEGLQKAKPKSEVVPVITDFNPKSNKQ